MRGMAKWNDVALSREEQHRQKRRALIAAAGRAFRKQGFHQTSMDDVASALNVTKTALYYYVKNKQELLYECHNLAFDMGEEAIAEAEAGGGTGRERLEILIRAYILRLTDELGGGGVMSEDNALLPAQLEKIKERRRRWDQVFRGMVQEGIDDGSLQAHHPKIVEFCLMGAIRNLHRWYSPEGEMKGEEIAREFCAIFFDGLATPAEAAVPARRSGRRGAAE